MQILAAKIHICLPVINRSQNWSNRSNSPVTTGACGLSLCSYAKDGVLGGLDLVAPRYEITPEIIIADATRCRQIVVS